MKEHDQTLFSWQRQPYTYEILLTFCLLPLLTFDIIIFSIRFAKFDSVISNQLLRYEMVSMKKLTAYISHRLRPRRTKTRVYVYDPDLEDYRRTPFIRFYSALGCIVLPKPEKYHPDPPFTDIFSVSSSCSSASSSPVPSRPCSKLSNCSNFYDDFESDNFEDDLEIFILDE